ncbi:MAG: DUF6036 family nucleotidyltransferase [Phycisphaerales bacterium]
MKRHELEHVIRASAGITGADEFVIVGSQAILAQYPRAPGELTMSVEADVFTFRSAEDADLIDGSIGEGSPFHQTFGYYAHGISERAVVLPAGWRERLVRVRNENTNGATGLCLEVHDLAISKLAAGRKKDIDFIRALLKHRLADVETMRARLAMTNVEPRLRTACERRLKDLSIVA